MFTKAKNIYVSPNLLWVIINTGDATYSQLCIENNNWCLLLLALIQQLVGILYLVINQIIAKIIINPSEYIYLRNLTDPLHDGCIWVNWLD